jgi:hypothetical protein
MANNCEEGQGSQRAVVPVIMMMMMMMMLLINDSSVIVTKHKTSLVHDLTLSSQDNFNAT